MKSFTFSHLGIFFVLISAVVNGMPLERREGDELESGCDYIAAGAVSRRDLEARVLKHVVTGTALQFKNWLVTNKATVSAIPAILFSGESGTVHSQKGARLLATQYQGKTIADLTRKANIKYTGWTKDDWAVVCEVWTRDIATGTAYVALGKKIPADATWTQVELPELKANALVTSIKAFEVGDKLDANKKAVLTAKGDLKK
ncbi:hypothetical protein C8J56DRAFT_1049472 [Mycena floridula]|nr:hypothetical protein C8J56DRAFT_1052170 [Mycena floridula]KAJ7585817.1 hypothetical protein C8J56DRAFT_1052171 [Mycena floridula]KAJ7588563.1 hypothetical protein C8J56DRAFT_1049471 [Mycena floridula]KAJ7588564.1 hypothetical protein C8J56DRAFT_1049472 [Mycena floridula]